MGLVRSVSSNFPRVCVCVCVCVCVRVCVCVCESVTDGAIAQDSTAADPSPAEMQGSGTQLPVSVLNFQSHRVSGGFEIRPFETQLNCCLVAPRRYVNHKLMGSDSDGQTDV